MPSGSTLEFARSDPRIPPVVEMPKMPPFAGRRRTAFAAAAGGFVTVGTIPNSAILAEHRPLRFPIVHRPQCHSALHESCERESSSRLLGSCFTALPRNVSTHLPGKRIHVLVAHHLHDRRINARVPRKTALYGMSARQRYPKNQRFERSQIGNRDRRRPARTLCLRQRRGAAMKASSRLRFPVTAIMLLRQNSPFKRGRR